MGTPGGKSMLTEAPPARTLPSPRALPATVGGSGGRLPCHGSESPPIARATVPAKIARPKKRRRMGSFFKARSLYSARLMGYDSASDKKKDECGVFGIWALGHLEEAAHFTYLGLHALQHRGQESAGIVVTDGETLHVHRAMGLVADIFDAEVLARLKGGSAIGHVRYSTTGASHLKNAQPMAVQYAGGAVAVAHNGNLVNAEALRAELEAEGSIFQSSSDTEVIIHLIARARKATVDSTTADGLVPAIREALGRVAGAYSIVFLTPKALLGVRD